MSNPGVRLLLLVPAVMAAVLYWPATQFDYVWDDQIFLTALPQMHDWHLLWSMLLKPFEISASYFRPLALLSLAAEQNLSDGSTFVPHLDNILLHALNSTLTAALTAVLARRLLCGRQHAIAAGCLAGLLYAIHPALMEAAAWISVRFDLLASAFALGALLADRQIAATGIRALSVGVLVLCALLCKEMALTLVVLLPLWQRLAAGARSAVQRRSDRLTCAAAWAAAVLYLGVHAAIAGNSIDSGAADPWGGAAGRLALIAKCFYKYVELALWPFSAICPVHPFRPPVTFGDPEAWRGLLLMAAGAASAPWIWRRNGIAVLALAFGIALTPVLQLVPLSLGDNYVHERFMVFPLAFVAIGAALALANVLQLQPARQTARALAAGVAVLWLVFALLDVRVTLPSWHDDLRLWTWTLARAPASVTARSNLQYAYVTYGLYAQALDMSQRIDAAGGLTANEHVVYADVLQHFGRSDEALEQLRAAQALPGARHGKLMAAIHAKAGSIRLARGEPAAALEELRQAVALQPYSPYTLSLLGIALTVGGDASAGASALRQAYSYVHPAEAAQLRIANGLLQKKAADAARMRGGIAQD